MITTRPCPFRQPANDARPVTSLDDARLRREIGFALTDPAAPVHPRSRLRPGAFACLPNGIVIRIRQLRWIRPPEGPAADGDRPRAATLHADYTVNGIAYSVPLADLTPSQYQPAQHQQSQPQQEPQP